MVHRQSGLGRRLDGRVGRRRRRIFGDYGGVKHRVSRPPRVPGRVVHRARVPESRPWPGGCRVRVRVGPRAWIRGATARGRARERPCTGCLPECRVPPAGRPPSYDKMADQAMKFAAVLLFATVLLAQSPEYGPPKGTLVIQGGGTDEGTGIFETFINLAGGLDAKIVVVPTAAGNRGPDGHMRVYKPEEVLATWKQRGATNVHMLHTHDPKVADTGEFASVLRDARGVWFNGGRQW